MTLWEAVAVLLAIGALIGACHLAFYAVVALACGAMDLFFMAYMRSYALVALYVLLWVLAWPVMLPIVTAYGAHEWREFEKADRLDRGIE